MLGLDANIIPLYTQDFGFFTHEGPGVRLLWIQRDNFNSRRVNTFNTENSMVSFCRLHFSPYPVPFNVPQCVIVVACCDVVLLFIAPSLFDYAFLVLIIYFSQVFQKDTELRLKSSF